MSQPLVIVAASARAAAFSARRAGFSPRCADLFADVDLSAIAPVTRIDEYPATIHEAVAQYRGQPLIYGGALENHPAVVDRLAECFMLLGNRGDVLRAVRDPFRLRSALVAAGVAVPEVAADGDHLPRDGTWLVKPLRGSAGVGIRPWVGDERGGGSCYFQERVDGVSCSAMFVAARGRARWLGATAQLIGKPWTGAGPFQYCGSIGPMRMNSDVEQQWSRIGWCLAREFDLAGLFGVDAVLSGGIVRPVEVNPRYTASVEILERGTAANVVPLHVDACRNGALPDDARLGVSECCGKAILFARRDVTVPTALTTAAVAANRATAWPVYADIPQAGSFIRAGRPVMTVLASGADEHDVEQKLMELANRAEGMLVG